MRAGSNLGVSQDLRLLVSGNAVSALGNAVYLIAVTLLLKELTDSVFALGLFQFLSIIPGFLLSPLTGAIIDRASRRAIIIITDTFRGLLMIGAGLALAVPALQSVWLILPVSLAAGVGHALFVPAAQALLPAIVPPQRLQHATALRASSSQVANLGGNAAGGLLYTLLGAPVLFVLNGVSFLISAAFELRISRDKSPSDDADSGHDARAAGGLLSAASAGLRELRAQPVLIRLMISQAGLFALSPVLMLALPFIVIDELGLPEFVVGVYFSLALAGGIVCFLSVRRLSSSQLLEIPLVRVSYLALAAGFFAAAFLSGPLVLGVIAFITGAAAAGVYLTVTTWIQLRMPGELHGRLFSLLEAGSSAIAPISYLVAGAVLASAGTGGRGVVFAATGAVAAGWAGFIGLSRRSVI